MGSYFLRWAENGEAERESYKEQTLPPSALTAARVGSARTRNGIHLLYDFNYYAFITKRLYERRRFIWARSSPTPG